jgi:4-amino-4-deoxy-L-arabinose transferase-like glycosyltransferase
VCPRMKVFTMMLSELISDWKEAISVRVSEFTGYVAPLRWLKAKAMNWARFADVRTLPWWDIAAVTTLLIWLCSLMYIQQFHSSIPLTDPIIHYFPAAQQVLEGRGYRAFEADVYRGPGYPFALAVVARLLHGDIFAAAKVVAAVSSVLFLVFAYSLVRRIFDPITALAAVLMTLGMPTFTWVSVGQGTNIPFSCLAMGSLYFTARRDIPTQRDAALAGFLGGLALAVRWPGLLIPLFILVRVALLPARELGLRPRIRIIAAYVLGFLLASGPWLYVNYLLHGSPLHSENIINLDASIVPASDSLSGSLRQTLRQGALGFGLRFAKKLFGYLPLVIKALYSYPLRVGWARAIPLWVLVPLGVLFLLMRSDRLRLWLLLVSGIWWASMTMIHFEPRFYMLLVSIFSALMVFAVTSGALPDIRLMVGREKWAKITPGYVLRRLLGRRLPGWLAGNPSGTGLLSLILIGLLAVAAFSMVKRVQLDYRWISERYSFHHELARFVRELQGPERLRPIGARQWSQARYWIPSESGTPVVPLPAQDYESVLPQLSYVLYDQIEGDDTLYDWWDDPKLSALADPLRAPANLEPVYYKPDPYRTILYRILEQSDPARITSTEVSSSLPQHPAAQAADSDAQTWWSSALHASENASESITFDLGGSTSINRVWLLPRSGGQAFPSALRIEVSQDGTSWQRVIRAEGLLEPVQQSPRIFSFSETVARYVKITATRLRRDEEEGGCLFSLVEARVSLAVERPCELPAFSIASNDIFFDPLSSELAASVRNESRAPGRATVELYEGWSDQEAEHLATVESSVAGPGGVGVARLSPVEWAPLEPGHCRPIWATLKPSAWGDLDLDTYGVVSLPPQTVFNLVCSPEQAVIDDFTYPDSPLAQGWSVPPDQTAAGEVGTTYDRELGRRVMQVSSEAEDGFVMTRWMRVYDRPKLTLWVNSASDFIIYVRLRDVGGEHYYVQYMPFTWDRYAEDFPEGRYIYYPLGSEWADGGWHRLGRDVYEDFSASTGREVDYIEALSVRAYDDLALADLKLDVRE